MNLDVFIVQKLRELAQQHDADKIVLFGSRARGDNYSRSDVDLAVWGLHDAIRYLDFQEGSVRAGLPPPFCFREGVMNSSPCKAWL